MQRFNPQWFWLMMAMLMTVSVRPLASAMPVSVELNGVCDIFGDRRAVLAINPEAGAQNIILAEGESAGGIKLIAVDMAVNCVRIENGGQVQRLRLCGTLNLAPRADASGEAEVFLARGLDGMVGSPGADGRMVETSPGNPGWGTLPPVASGNRPTKKSNTISSPDDSSNSQTTDSVAALKSQADTEWYQESESIEQNRKDSAAQVLAGEMEPWPRTPLTPAGTPSALVGSGLFFSNHVPRYVVTGSLN